MIKHKICPECGFTKRTTQFYKREAMRDGLETKCKECRKQERNGLYANKAAAEGREVRCHRTPLSVLLREAHRAGQ